ncbi:YciI family protein [Amycolatopsis anabasis]|uniref:YciI family protein n=1 Tax=Amycolatopsis anabasis TaxID=1840409 RepID=UPI00131A985E|nr:YciI family protein [Amycolatopsis anabasis]
MPRFVGFAVGGGEHPDWADPELAERALERYAAWDEEVRAQGRYRGGVGLASEAKVLRKKESDVLVSDGPFAEAAEVIGGYAEIEAADLDEAIAVFRTHPHLDYGFLEVREVTLR